MAAKPDPKEAPPSAAKDAAPAAPAKTGSLVPVILAVILAPVVSWAVIEFVMFPRLLKKAAAHAPAAGEHAAEAPAAEPAHEAKGGHGGGEKGKESGAPANSYEFTNVVVNLSGTMGTRYLKTSFIVTGKDASIKGAFEADKARLTDVTLGVLSSLSLADLEEPGSKNILRERLVGAYNQTLGRKLADQVYFSDFVVQ